MRCYRPCCDRREGRSRESCDPHPVLPPNPKCGFRGRGIESLNETRDNQFGLRNAVGVAAGVTVRYRGGVGCVAAVRAG